MTGLSGAGKSTVSRLALESGRLVLSDDLNAVVVDGGRPWVQQVPFTGDLGGSRTTRGRFPLGRVFRLRQAAAAALRPMSRAEAVALLYGCAPYVNADPLRRDQLLANLEACMAGVPAGELSFRRDGTFWPLLAGRKAS
jgi:adenylylsulfate kinase-like enzyme